MKYKINFKITKAQWVVISEICRDLAQILFASAVVSPILLGINSIDWAVLCMGSIISILLWVASVIIVKK